MLLTGIFQAKKLTKRVKDNKVYRTLWIKDEDDDDLQVSFTEDLLGQLKKDGVYKGIFDFSQYQKYEGYGVDDRIKLVAVEELKQEWKVSGSWEI